MLLLEKQTVNIVTSVLIICLSYYNATKTDLQKFSQTHNVVVNVIIQCLFNSLTAAGIFE